MRRRNRQPLAPSTEAVATVAEVDVGYLEALLADVFPHVHLGPVGQREHAHVFTRVEPGVVEVPDFRALVLRIPLAEGVAEAKEALLGPGLLFVTACAADAAVEAELFDGTQQHRDL